MGVFCLWVMAFHGKYVFTCPPSLNSIWLIVLRGNAAVDAFFLLSGISLYFAYSKMMASDLGAGRRLTQFYWRRFVRLFIPYLLIAAPYLAWVAWTREQGIRRFLKDFFQVSLVQKGDMATWYIPALALFYLLFPLIYRLQQKPMKLRGQPISRGSVTFLLYFIAAAIGWACLKFAPTFYKNTEIVLTRLPVFILGCGLGKWVKEKKPLPNYAVIGSGVFLFIYIYILGPSIKTSVLWIRLSYALFALAAILVFAWAFSKLDRVTWLRKIFAFVGERSLELYLTHGLIRLMWQWYLVRDLTNRQCVLAYLCILLIAFAVSVILHPIIKWLSKKLLSTRGTPKETA